MPAATTKLEAEPRSADTPTACTHCGEPCGHTDIQFEGHHFCCEGCKTVYTILNENGMCRYYDIDEKAGFNLKGKKSATWAFLDDEAVREKLIDFRDGEQARATFYIPAIHCASCLWLLENLYKFNPAILASKVNFVSKEVFIHFRESEMSLRQVVELLDSIAYTPAINLSNLDGGEKPVVDRSFYYKFGVAGFAFGNIMLLSFPEYLGLDKALEGDFFQLFGYLNLLLALPLVFYSGKDYLLSAWSGLRKGNLNIDVPIALGVLTLFGRSAFEILTHSGPGYLDSLAGLVFFLLAGKWFQQRTYHNISFERDYKSYFPIAAHRLDGKGATENVTLDKLEPGDHIRVGHGELIPADGILISGESAIDYSFVTGESDPVSPASGDKVYAGGRQTGPVLEIALTRRVSQSYLTQLWNDEAFTKSQDSPTTELANRVGKYFTIAILLIGAGTLFYWLPKDTGMAVNAFTAVLIIACPCAVALAVPFIFGNALRVLARHRFFLKNAAVIERMAQATAVVFDKTGTLTERGNGHITFHGAPLTPTEAGWAAAAAAPSNHPVSQQIQQLLEAKQPAGLSGWEEVTGQGVKGWADGHEIRIGKPAFAVRGTSAGTGTWLSIDGEYRGHFISHNRFRQGLSQVIEFFKQKADIYLLSGDNDRERAHLAPLFPEAALHFHQAPKDKLSFVKQLQDEGQQVLMLGDGLNDAGALKQSEAGIVLTEDTNNFTPACDGILDAKAFQQLPVFTTFARKSIRLVYYAYAFALVYNTIGLSFAVQGALSPIVAAILMPLSSISIVLFGTLSSNWTAHRMGL